MARKKKGKKKKKSKAPAKAPRAEVRAEEVVDQTADEAVEPVDAAPEEAVEVIDLGDELDDDGDARERLIAEAMALAASEEAAADADYAEPPSSDGEPASDASKAGARPTPSAEVPTLTPSAFAALSAIHREGLAKAGGELVLDLGEGTTPEERDRLLAAALAHAEMQEAIYRVPVDTGRERRWKGTIATVVFVIALLLAARPPGILVPPPPATLSAADRAQGVRVALLVQAQQVEAFRVRSGRLPDSLEEVAVALPGIRFVKSSPRLYQLVAYLPDGEAVVYDSAIPAREFSAIARSWVTTSGTT